MRFFAWAASLGAWARRRGGKGRKRRMTDEALARIADKLPGARGPRTACTRWRPRCRCRTPAGWRTCCAPLPHTAHYDPARDGEVLHSFDRIDAGEVTEAEADLYDARLRAGTLVLCDEGCGYLHFLVVTGPARGTMWIDSRCSDGGYGPLGVTFLEWYERWLDDTLAGGHGTWWLGPPVYPPGASPPA